ncbi:MAG: 50S ribosomal protein L4 [Acidimicrobiales bacterium]
MATAPANTNIRVDLHRGDGTAGGTRNLDPNFFGLEPNVALMHQVVTAQLAAARSGTQNTKTRAEVRGGGAKPWRQKGTGRARQGSTRAPHWAGGGVALGPKPRSYKQRTPKKMVALALRSALSDRAAQGRIALVEGWSFDGPRTKDAVKLLSGIGVAGKILVVIDRDDDNATLSFRNLPEVKLILASELNAYDVLCSDWVLFTEATLPGAPVAVAAPAEPAAAPAEPAAAPAEAVVDEPAAAAAGPDEEDDQ